MLEKLTSNQIAVERVTVKTFTKYRCDVVITDRSKLWRMGKSLQECGGTGRKNQINKRKQTEWTVELNASEIVSWKRKPDNVVASVPKDKCAKLQEDLKQCNQKLKDMTNEISGLKKSNKALSLALKCKGSGTGTTPSRKKKQWSKCST